MCVDAEGGLANSVNMGPCKPPGDTRVHGLAAQRIHEAREPLPPSAACRLEAEISARLQFSPRASDWRRTAHLWRLDVSSVGCL